MKTFRRIVATSLAALMIMVMGTTAFAATAPGGSLVDGSYTAKQNLYKNVECTNPSMGDKALNDLRANITIDGDNATLTVNTHEISYLGIKGHLSEMEINGQIGDFVKVGSTYSFTFTGLDKNMISNDCVIEGQFTTEVAKMPKKSTGYLKLSDIK